MKKELQRNVNGVMSGGGSIEHPFSIHSASIGSRWKLHGLQSLMMTILLLFTMGIGQMWGDTWNVNLTGSGVNKDGITLTGSYVANAQVGSGSQTANSLQAKTASVCVFSEQTNITAISFKMCRATNSNSATKAVSIYTSTGGDMLFLRHLHFLPQTIVLR